MKNSNIKTNTDKATIEVLNEVLLNNFSKDVDSILSSGSVDDRISRLVPLFTLAIDGFLSSSHVNSISEDELSENLFSLSECWHEIRRLISHQQEEHQAVWDLIRNDKMPKLKED
ncbi:hypothetical protein [Gracilimonas sp.]|uniref:hypothetical protein n=1 Tax=Gracilimonas sp. TaxID=1974203 RepID=UPI003BABBCBA